MNKEEIAKRLNPGKRSLKAIAKTTVETGFIIGLGVYLWTKLFSMGPDIARAERLYGEQTYPQLRLAETQGYPLTENQKKITRCKESTFNFSGLAHLVNLGPN